MGLGTLAVSHPQAATPDKSMWNLLCVSLVGMLVILSLCLCPPVCDITELRVVGLVGEVRCSKIALEKPINYELA